MDIFSVLNNDIFGLTDEERAFTEDFNYKLREKIIEELVEYEKNNLINNLKADK